MPIAYYAEPWPRLPRKTKKLLDRNDPKFSDKRGYWHSKEHRRDRKRWAQYMDRRVAKP